MKTSHNASTLLQPACIIIFINFFSQVALSTSSCQKDEAKVVFPALAMLESK